MDVKNMIVIRSRILAAMDKVWTYYTEPRHIVRWNTASPDWHCPKAENDLRSGGRFVSRMEARDGSYGFDFGGTYTEVVHHKQICYTMDDNRKVDCGFQDQDGSVLLEIQFEPEAQNSKELQKKGWQSILDNFRKYVEAH